MTNSNSNKDHRVAYITSNEYIDIRKEIFESIKRYPELYGIKKSSKDFEYKDLHEYMINLVLEKLNLVTGKTTSTLKSDTMIVTAEVKEDLKGIEDECPRVLLKFIGYIPACFQRVDRQGIKGIQFFIYPKGHPKEGHIYSREDIRTFCEGCIQIFTEPERYNEALKKVYGYSITENNKIRIYICRNPNIIGTMYAQIPESKFECFKDNRNVRIDRTCERTRCDYLLKQDLPIMLSLQWDEDM